MRLVVNKVLDVSLFEAIRSKKTVKFTFSLDREEGGGDNTKMAGYDKAIGLMTGLL